MSGDNASNGANAPPLERDLTDSHLPGVPSPRMPNCESWAVRRSGGLAVKNTAATTAVPTARPPDRLTAALMAPRTGIASRT